MKMDVQGKTHFLVNGFTQRLVLAQGKKGTREWPIAIWNVSFFSDITFKSVRSL